MYWPLCLLLFIKYFIYIVGLPTGGTADITVHEKLEDGNLKELHKADGINCGGVDVDVRICEFLSEFMEMPDMFNRSKDAPDPLSDSSFFDIQRSIETLKRQIKHETHTDIVYDFPFLKMRSGREVCNSLKDASARYCERSDRQDVKHRYGPKIALSSSLVKGFFSETIDKIIQRIQKVLSESPDSGSIKTILLVGGFSESSLVSGKIREYFTEKNVVVPVDAGLAILKGAVLYGFDNDIIISRILTHSYGYEVCKEFDPTTDSGRETFTEDGEVYCRGAFSEIVAANREIKTGEIVRAGVQTLSDYQPAIRVDFYACPNRTPRFVDDPDCSNIGNLCVPLLIPLPAGRPVILLFRFGGTVIKAAAMDTILPLPVWTSLKLKEN